MQLNLNTQPPSQNTEAHVTTTLIGLPHTLAIHNPLYPYPFNTPCFSTRLFLSCRMLKINVLWPFNTWELLTQTQQHAPEHFFVWNILMCNYFISTLDAWSTAK